MKHETKYRLFAQTWFEFQKQKEDEGEDETRTDLSGFGKPNEDKQCSERGQTASQTRTEMSGKGTKKEDLRFTDLFGNVFKNGDGGQTQEKKTAGQLLADFQKSDIYTSEGGGEGGEKKA